MSYCFAFSNLDNYGFLSWNNFKTVLGFYAEYISAVCIELCSSYACSIAHNMRTNSDSCKEVWLYNKVFDYFSCVNVRAFCNLVPTVNLYVCVYRRIENRHCIWSACNAILGIVHFHNFAIQYHYADNNTDCFEKE